MAVSMASLFGCKKLDVSDESIDKAITVLEYAKTAKKLINAGNANSIADQLLKDVNTDKDDEETSADTSDEESEETSE